MKEVGLDSDGTANSQIIQTSSNNVSPDTEDTSMGFVVSSDVTQGLFEG